LAKGESYNDVLPRAIGADPVLVAEEVGEILCQNPGMTFGDDSIRVPGFGMKGSTFVGVCEL
jgi:hypothetical protein